MSTAEISRELINLAAPAAIEITNESEESVRIKGFASVQVEDRSNDVVPPEEFNIKQFMAAPVLLVNHDFWVDDSGNRISAGRPLELHVAKLVKHDTDKTLFKVKSLTTGEVISDFPKEKIPNLKAGDRGLFAVVEVTQPDVVKMVRAGELGAFSWRGLAKTEFRVQKSTNEIERVLTDIDLWEISLVHIPDNPNSTFTVGKSVYAVKLDKSRFESSGVALEYLKHHRLDYDMVLDTSEAYQCRQSGHTGIDIKKLELFKMADGVQVIAGPRVKTKEWTANILDSNIVDELIDSYSKGEQISLENTMSEETKTTEEKTVETTNDGAEERQKAVEEMTSAISEKTAKLIVEGLSTSFETMTTTMKSIADTMESIISKMAPKEEEKKEEEQKDDTQKDVFSKLNELAENMQTLQGSLEENQKKLAVVAKSAVDKVDALAKTTADETEREEVLKSTSDKKKKDPNSVFDSVFAFIGN